MSVKKKKRKAIRKIRISTRGQINVTKIIYASKGDIGKAQRLAKKLAKKGENVKLTLYLGNVKTIKVKGK